MSTGKCCLQGPLGPPRHQPASEPWLSGTPWGKSFICYRHSVNIPNVGSLVLLPSSSQTEAKTQWVNFYQFFRLLPKNFENIENTSGTWDITKPT